MTPSPDTRPPPRFTPPGSATDSSQLDSSFYLPEAAEVQAGMALERIGWRRRVLLLVVVGGCLAVFLLARWLAHLPTVDAEWRLLPSGQLELVTSPTAALRNHAGATLHGVVNRDGELLPLATPTTASARWWTADAERSHLIEQRLAVAHMLESGALELQFSDGLRALAPTQARGYADLGAMFWVMSVCAMVLYLIGWVVPLVQPRPCNLLYAVMAHAQALQLLLAAVSTVPGLALPALLVGHEADLRTLLDIVTGAAIVHAVTLHPMVLPWGRSIAGAVWLIGLGQMALAWVDVLPHRWWVAQASLLGMGVLVFVLLTLSYRLRSHPFTLVMRRFCVVATGSLALLSLVESLRPVMPPEALPLTAIGPMIWGVFFGSVILLIPFTSRSQSVMREFAMLAGISTLATSIDLLFVAVFSFSQFASLTLALFLALGAYAAIRQWLLSQMMGMRALTTERMFEHLYRIAREVEARPERAADRMIELLRNVFEPLETVRSEGRAKQSRIGGNGAVLIVPLPNLTQGPTVDGIVTLRFAERGKRLFTPDDAKLADRVLEQLMRALAHDRAVERGRSEERARIAQDLHDDIGARLLTLMYKAPSKEMEDYVRHTLQDLKTLTRGLAAKKHSLALAAAEWKTDVTLRLEAIHCELEWNTAFDQDIPLSMVQWSSLTRIVRELVSNVISHSRATRVQIDCALRQGRFTLVITDNGVGREPSRWSHGLGLGGIRKRVKLMGGTVAWREGEVRGIVCTVIVPQLAEPV